MHNDFESNYLVHHGILGQKWGVRRYQNADGSLTSAGRKRYGRGESMDANLSSDSAVTRRVKNDYNTMSNRDFAKKYQTTKNTYRKRVNKYGDPYMNGTKAKYGKALNKKPEDRTAEDKKIIAKETAKAAAKIGITYTAAIATISAALFVAQGQQEKRASAAISMLEAKRINGKSLRDLTLSDLSKLDLY